MPCLFHFLNEPRAGSLASQWATARESEGKKRKFWFLSFFPSLTDAGLSNTGWGEGVGSDGDERGGGQVSEAKECQLGSLGLGAGGELAGKKSDTAKASWQGGGKKGVSTTREELNIRIGGGGQKW